MLLPIILLTIFSATKSGGGVLILPGAIFSHGRKENKE